MNDWFYRILNKNFQDFTQSQSIAPQVTCVFQRGKHTFIMMKSDRYHLDLGIKIGINNNRTH